MSINLKARIRNRCVDDATLRGFLNATNTGSAHVSPVFMEQTGLYPQIIYSIAEGPTDPGITGSKNGNINFLVQAQATGGVHPHITIGNIFERISGLFDDQNISGQGISATAINILHSIGVGGVPVAYDADRKVYGGIKIFSYKIFDGTP